MMKRLLSPKLKASIREIIIIFRRCKFFARYITDCGSLNKKRIIYIVENANWSIRWDGINITKRLSKRGFDAGLDVHPSFYANRILSFGSANVFYNLMSKRLLKKNKIVLTYFHGDFEISNTMDQQLSFVLSHKNNISALVVANKIMQERFVKWGFDPSKVHLIPLGIDVKRFSSITNEKTKKLRQKNRQKLGISEDTFVIGSFQKDGSGWGEGLTPKLIKGPDVFLEVLSKLPNREKLFCLLSGPSRGYVKQGLDKLGIAYKHFHFDNPDEVANLYALSDMYLISSREEGGPKAVLEAMASGVPLVTTKVGMAGDIIENGVNGLMVEVNDIEGLVDAISKVRNNAVLCKNLSQKASLDVSKFDWDKITLQYEGLYSKITEIKNATD
ncbi:glycosyltransferase family 4 protein [Alphaproteobacteria bacterium]|nr:glycosyltransferase family 4 protein [Alphaproteobacteria bacterium]